MNVFFDVDYTIISYEGVLRPHVMDVFKALVEDGHKIYIWSGVGLRHEVVRHHGLGPYVSGIYVKPIERYREMLPKLGVDITPDFIVDDHREIVEVFGGMQISPYTYPSRHDTEMLRAYNLIRHAAETRQKNQSPNEGA